MKTTLKHFSNALWIIAILSGLYIYFFVGTLPFDNTLRNPVKAYLWPETFGQTDSQKVWHMVERHAFDSSYARKYPRKM